MPKKTKTGKSKSKKQTNLKTTIKKEIKNYVSKKVEHKVEQFTSQNNIISSYAYNTSLFVVSCIPYNQIVLGTGAGDRIGNQIRPSRVYFNYVLHPIPYSAVGNPAPVPQDVIIFFGKVKNSRAQQPNSADFAKLWQAGDSSRAPFSTTLDMIQDINKDWFTVSKIMRHKVSCATINGTGGSAANQYYHNNDYKYNVIRRLDITKYVPKVIKFNDTTNQNTNDGLWMWAMCVNADGTTNSTYTPMYMDVTLNFYYTDE